MPRQILVGAVLIVAVCLIPAGCGGEDAEPRPGSTTVTGQVLRYYAALARGNGEAACDVLTEQAAGGFEAVLSGPVSPECEANIEALSRVSVLEGRPRVTRVKRVGEQATAHVTFENPRLESDVVLAREDDVWKLSQLPAVLEPTP